MVSDDICERLNYLGTWATPEGIGALAKTAKGCADAAAEITRLRAALAEARKCTICGEPTELACSDCRIDVQTTIYVCKKSECRNEHERKCSAMLSKALAAAREAVSKQANDEGLWFVAQTCAEAYLQQELRRLHEIIEGKSSEDCARTALQGHRRTEGT